MSHHQNVIMFPLFIICEFFEILETEVFNLPQITKLCFSFFFRTNTLARYLPAIFMTIFSTFTMGFTYNTIDILFFCYCFYIQAFLRHLQLLLIHVDDLIDETAIFSNVNSGLKRCIFFHNEIISYMDRIHRLFSPIIFLQFIDSFVILCTAIFQSTVPHTSVWESWKFVLFLMGGCGQLFIFTYLGTMVSSEFQRVGDAAYNCKWYSYQKSSRKSIVLIIQRAQREFIFLGLSLFRNNLQQFLSVRWLSKNNLVFFK